MFSGWLLIAVSLAYIAVLFAIAWRGDRRAKRQGPSQRRPVIYSLALAIYCTSWTFYGAVGEAAVRVAQEQCPGGFRLISNFGYDGMQSQDHAHVHILGGMFLGEYA